MPKQKTHKGLMKRIRVGRKGAIKFKHPGHGHLLSGKPSKRKRKARRIGVLDKVEAPKIKRLLGHP